MLQNRPLHVAVGRIEPSKELQNTLLTLLAALEANESQVAGSEMVQGLGESFEAMWNRVLKNEPIIYVMAPDKKIRSFSHFRQGQWSAEGVAQMTRVEELILAALRSDGWEISPGDDEDAMIKTIESAPEKYIIYVPAVDRASQRKAFTIPPQATREKAEPPRSSIEDAVSALSVHRGVQAEHTLLPMPVTLTRRALVLALFGAGAAGAIGGFAFGRNFDSQDKTDPAPAVVVDKDAGPPDAESPSTK